MQLSQTSHGSAVGRSATADRIAAVQRHRQNAGDRRLSDASVSAEDITVGDPTLRERIHQRHGHVILPRDIGEALRTILSR